MKSISLQKATAVFIDLFYLFDFISHLLLLKLLYVHVVLLSGQDSFKASVSAEQTHLQRLLKAVFCRTNAKIEYLGCPATHPSDLEATVFN